MLLSLYRRPRESGDPGQATRLFHTQNFSTAADWPKGERQFRLACLLFRPWGPGGEGGARDAGGRWAGERVTIPRLTPTLSTPKGGEGERCRLRHIGVTIEAYDLSNHGEVYRGQTAVRAIPPPPSRFRKFASSGRSSTLSPLNRAARRRCICDLLRA